MGRRFVVILALAALSGCAAGVKKSFTVVAEPSDAEIRVVSGEGLKEKKYRSPADVTVRLPKDSVLLSKNILEVTKPSFKPKTIRLRDIREGQRVTVRLDPIVRYRLQYGLASPVRSEDLTYRDKVLSVSFSVEERSFLMNIQNNTSREMKILWSRAEYTDVNNSRHRLMHSGIRYQDRNSPIPAQLVPPRGSLRLEVMSARSVVFSPEKKTYENRPLFPLDDDIAMDLKGRAFYLFIPVEVDRQIIPYNFKVQITDVVKEL